MRLVATGRRSLRFAPRWPKRSTSSMATSRLLPSSRAGRGTRTPSTPARRRRSSAARWRRCRRRRGADADRAHHLRGAQAGADRAASGRGADRAGRPARADALRVPLRGEDEVMRARGWRLREDAVELPGGLLPGPLAHGPDDGEPGDFFPTGSEVGYHSAVDYRFIDGELRRAGAGDGLDALARPGVRGRGDLAARTGTRRRRLGQRRLGDARLAEVPLHQRRSERPPPPPARGRVGLPRRGDPAPGGRRRARRHRALRRARARSAGRRRRSWWRPEDERRAPSVERSSVRTFPQPQSVYLRMTRASIAPTLGSA